MSEARDVLDRNLALLIGRAYEPARPRPTFRAALRERVLASVRARAAAAAVPVAAMPAGAAARAASPGTPTSPAAAPRAPSPPWRAARPLRATVRRGAPLAAAALLLAAVWLLLRFGAPSTLPELLARGQLAHRAAPTQPWRGEHPVAGELRVALLPAVGEWVLPPAVALRVDVRGRGELVLDGPARLALHEGGERGLHATLHDGRLRLRAHGAGEPWQLVTPEAQLVLEEGEVQVAVVAGAAPGQRVRVDLGEARAWVVGSGGELLGPVAGRSAPELPVPAGGTAEPLRAGPDEDGEAVSAAEEAEEVGEPLIVRGVVREAEDGTPVTAFVVTAVPRLPAPNVADPSALSVHDEHGAFALGPLRAGTYELLVHAPGRATARRELQLDEGVPAPPLELELGPGLRLSGRVVDAASGQPVAGAVVCSESDAPATVLPVQLPERDEDGSPRPLPPGAAVTDEDGRFELCDLSSERHVLRASAEGRAPAWSAPLQAVAGEPSDEVLLALPAGTTVHGIVRGDDGLPRSGAAVVGVPSGTRVARVMTFAAARTDDEGRFTLSDLPPGFCAVLVVEDGPPPEPRPVHDGGSPARRTPAWTAGPMALVELPAGGTLRVDLPPVEEAGVTVTGVLHGPRAPGAMVGLYDLAAPTGGDSQRFAAPDEHGRFVFTGVRPGRHGLFLAPRAGPDHVVLDELLVPDVPRLQHDVLLPEHVLDVRVVDGDGAPQAFAVLVLQRQLGGGAFGYAGKLSTDARGEVSVPALAAGRYRVSAHPTRGAYGSLEVEVDVPAAPVVLTVPPGGELLVRAVDGEGRPLPGARVRLFDAAGDERQLAPWQVTDAQGVFGTSGAAAGAWTVQVEHERGRASARVEVAAGEIADATLVVVPP